MEKVSDMLVYLTNKHIKDPVKDAEVENVDVDKLLKEQQEMQIQEQEKKKEKKSKLDVLRAKVKVVARMNRIFKTIRNNQEEILAIK